MPKAKNKLSLKAYGQNLLAPKPLTISLKPNFSKRPPEAIRATERAESRLREMRTRSLGTELAFSGFLGVL